MPTYLLTWNPNRYAWPDLPDMAARLRRGDRVADRWSCGNTKRIELGDRFFLLRQGEEPRGIVASGWVIESAFSAPHWDRFRVGPAVYVMIQYDVLLDPSVDAILPRQALDTPPLQQVHWNTQSSGIQIPDAIVTPLETLWASFTPQLVVTTADEIADGAGLHEGATKRIAVNAFERNPLARQRCVAYYGPRCVICGFDFEQVYGEAGTGFMHVHHLVPLSEIGKDYQVDPVRDLRPVCPNCHAILHRRNPAYTIDEMRALVTSASVRH